MANVIWGTLSAIGVKVQEYYITITETEHGHRLTVSMKEKPDQYIDIPDTDMQEAIDRSEELSNEVTTAETRRASAEQQRATAETSRQTAETARQNAENEREQAETNRNIDLRMIDTALRLLQTQTQAAIRAFDERITLIEDKLSSII